MSGGKDTKMSLADVISSIVTSINISEEERVNAIVYLFDGLGCVESIEEIYAHVKDVHDYENSDIE